VFISKISRKFQLSLVLTIYSFTFLHSGIVLAGNTDVKVYPAFMCLELGKETGDFDRSMFRVTRKGSIGKGILLCPIVRDKVRATGIGKEPSGTPFVAKGYPTGFTIKVWTYRQNSGPAIRLTVHNRAYDGSSISKETKYVGTGNKITEIFIKSKANSGFYVLEVEMGINSRTVSSQYAKFHSYEIIE
jgi:hypothetical protein